MLHLSERLSVVEIKLDQKADKADLDKLEAKLMTEMASIKSKVASVQIGLASFKDYSQNNFKFVIGFFITILIVLIGIALK